MKSLFKLQYLILYLVCIQSYAQTKQVFKKELPVDTKTEAIFNLKNTTVLIEPSTDGKMHFDYEVNFENYSKKDINSILSNISVTAEKFENTITLVSKNITKTPRIAIRYKADNGLTMSDDLFGFKSKSKDSLKIYRKSKDSLIRMMNDNPLKNFFEKFKELDDKGNPRRISKSNVKIIRSAFVIKVPPYVPLTITGTDTQITFVDNIQNEIQLDVNRGFLRAEVLANKENYIKVGDATCRIETVLGGNFIFNNVKNGILGSINHATIDSEFSNVEIGVIGKNTKIRDFNSTYWLYNFTEGFERFNVLAEYSKLYLFCPETDYELSTFGHNTIHYIDGLKITMQLNREGKKSKMMEHKAKTDTPVGHIDLDIVNGVLYTTDEFIIEN